MYLHPEMSENVNRRHNSSELIPFPACSQSSRPAAHSPKIFKVDSDRWGKTSSFPILQENSRFFLMMVSASSNLFEPIRYFAFTSSLTALILSTNSWGRGNILEISPNCSRDKSFVNVPVSYSLRIWYRSRRRPSNISWISSCWNPTASRLTSRILFFSKCGSPSRLNRYRNASPWGSIFS